MNKFLVYSLLALSIACSSDDDTVNNGNDDQQSNDDQQDNSDPQTYDITPILSKFDNVPGLSYAIRGNVVEITTDDLPNHGSPYWDQSHPMYEAYNGDNPDWRINPNMIETQNFTFTIPLNPEEATNKEATSLGAMGVSVNGVVFYNQYAGPDNQPLTSEINSFDQYLGHPDGGGRYHYHIEPTFLTNTLGKSGFLGLLADGFPVYGPEENGGPVTNEDLDEYHGHEGVTDDFPNGIYHYHITSEAPYINGNGFFGTPGNISR
ncbi:YHYH protein [Tenacibaculum agarivorans]|uniref:YHYH protein n=1 Tax=Tenacibaculum agarivorans TaxID=1908389 RepID=UPI000B02C2BB|nr:YHYH protein [Tenacibaculum agarivorans]